MSGILGQEDISIRKEDFPGGKDKIGTASLVFAHQASGGETSVNLGALVAPASMVSNGFVNPSPSQISAANLFFFRKNLSLFSSLRGQIHDYDSYTVATGMMINLKFNLEEDEIILGKIQAVQSVGPLGADVKPFHVTYELPVGQTIVPLGVTFKVNQGANMQASPVMLVFRNGQAMLRNVGNAPASPYADGNFCEIDSGNGYGTSIEFNTPPSGTADSINVFFLALSVEGTPEIFSSIERIAGIVYAMAQDLAAATGEPVTNYMAASVSEIDRMTYAAMVLSNKQRIEKLEALPVIISANSSVLTPSVNAAWQAMSNNSITVPPGIWEISSQVSFTNNGTSPAYVNTGVGVFGANGANISSAPITVLSLPGVTSVGGGANSYNTADPGGPIAAQIFNGPLLIYKFENTVTLYAVPYLVATTIANARVTTSLRAKKLKDI